MSSFLLRNRTLNNESKLSRWVASAIKSCLVGGLLLSTTGSITAGEWSWDSVGARAGFSLTSSSHPYVQSEAFTQVNMPWTLHMGANWWLQPKVELTLGAIDGHGDTVFVGTLGPTFELRTSLFPIYLTGGSHPTLLSDSTLGDRNMGCLFEFTSHIGLGWDITKSWNVEYRFQHMSNAGIGSANPGLNMNLFGVGYRF